jgi:hypothetical protein
VWDDVKLLKKHTEQGTTVNERYTHVWVSHITVEEGGAETENRKGHVHKEGLDFCFFASEKQVEIVKHFPIFIPTFGTLRFGHWNKQFQYNKFIPTHFGPPKSLFIMNQ